MTYGLCWLYIDFAPAPTSLFESFNLARLSPPTCNHLLELVGRVQF